MRRDPRHVVKILLLLKLGCCRWRDRKVLALVSPCSKLTLRNYHSNETNLLGDECLRNQYRNGFSSFQQTLGGWSTQGLVLWRSARGCCLQTQPMFKQVTSQTRIWELKILSFSESCAVSRLNLYWPENDCSPWQSPPLETPQFYRSTDELLPSERERLHQTSPKLSNRSFDSHPSGSKWFEGWRLGDVYCAAVVAASLVLNVTVTIWASKTFGLSGGIGTIHRDTCPSIKHIGLWVHVAINVISTILLGASNYCMQCLCSPTRREVDKAHENNTWLDIGIQSFRNLMKIRKVRVVFWVLLAVSSIPLHLM